VTTAETLLMDARSLDKFRSGFLGFHIVTASNMLFIVAYDIKEKKKNIKKLANSNFTGRLLSLEHIR
jgi:hypothetical protein